MLIIALDGGCSDEPNSTGWRLWSLLVQRLWHLLVRSGGISWGFRKFMTSYDIVLIERPSSWLLCCSFGVIYYIFVHILWDLAGEASGQRDDRSSVQGRKASKQLIWTAKLLAL